MVVVYSGHVTDPTRSFPTDFGRFYAHPASGVPSALAAKAALFDDKNPYSPKPSVTNIISVKDKDFLPPYYARLVAEYAIDNLDSLKDVKAKFGDAVAIGTLKAVPNAPNPASKIGDEVHAAIDAYHNNREIPELTTITARRMFAQWMNFTAVHPMRIVRTEFTVWSYTHGYAGTGDVMCETDEGLWVVDNKSGAQVHPEVAMQCAAISKGDVILDPDGTEQPMPEIKVLGVAHIRPMSVKLHRLHRADEAFKAFLALKTVFDWMRFHQDSVIDPDPFVTQITKED